MWQVQAGKQMSSKLPEQHLKHLIARATSEALHCDTENGGVTGETVLNLVQ